jgi:hypothetical protein
MKMADLVSSAGTEAAQLKLAKFAERFEPQIKDRNAAAADLFERFEALAKESGLSSDFSQPVGSPDPKNEKYEVTAYVGKVAKVFVSIVCAGGTLYLNQTTKITELHYNPVERCFEGFDSKGQVTEGIEALADLVVLELTKAWDALGQADKR